MNQVTPTSRAASSLERAEAVPFAGDSPPPVPDYELLRRIGGGSYGEVWLARSATGVLRAVKIVWRHTFEDERPFQREFEGIQAFERLSREHPSQLALFHVGRGEGCFYYVMELADDASVAADVRRLTSSESVVANLKSEAKLEPPHVGCYVPHTLRHELQAHVRLPATRVLELALTLTEALSHLHAHGLVHRDIKPSNIIFVNGRPKLADIGLVTDAGDAQSIVGTEGYLAPEGPGTPQADIFALGKVFYEAVTGLDRRQFPQFPPDLRAWPDSRLVFELNEILLKSCASSARERYHSAEGMSADLELLRTGKSLKRQHAWQRALKRTKRLGLAVVALAAMSAIAYWTWSHQSRSGAGAQMRPPNFVWSTNEEANEEFRKGRNFLHAGGNSLQAIQHLQRATELDPDFADAYSWQARFWIASSGASNQSANARMAAEKAVSLNTNSALAHSVLATVKLGELDWAGADAERMRALDLAPDSEDILLTSALNLANMGRSKEALADLEKARRVAPGSASHFRTGYSGYVFAWSGQYDRALDVFNQFPNAHYWMKQQHEQAYLAKGDYPNAMRLGKQAALARGENTNRVNAEFDALEKAFNEGGKEEYWKQKLAFETPKSGEEHWMRMAAIHARLKEPEKAFEYLRRARRESPPYFSLGITTNPSFESLREDQRFRDLIAELWRKK